MRSLEKTLRVVTWPALALVLATACGDGDNGGTGNNQPPGNSPPVAVVMASPMNTPANDNNMTVVTIDASASMDADNDPLTFAWTVPNGTFVNGTTASDPVIQVTFPGLAPYPVTVTVSDGNGGSDMASVTIGVLTPTNNPPTASIASSHASVPAGDNNTTVVTLTGTANDPDGDPLTFQWSVSGGTFVNGTTPTDQVVQVTFPGLADYPVVLMVSDGRGGMGSANFNVALQ